MDVTVPSNHRINAARFKCAATDNTFLLKIKWFWKNYSSGICGHKPVCAFVFPEDGKTRWDLGTGESQAFVHSILSAFVHDRKKQFLRVSTSERNKNESVPSWQMIKRLKIKFPFCMFNLPDYWLSVLTSSHFRRCPVTWFTSTLESDIIDN